MLKAFKAVVYPLVGAMQFYVASQDWRLGHSIPFLFFGVVLIGLGILNLHNLATSESADSGPKKAGSK